MGEFLESKALREEGEKARERDAEEAGARATAEELRSLELDEMRGRLNRAFEAQLESERTIEMLRNQRVHDADSTDESDECEHTNVDDRVRELDDHRKKLEKQLEASREESKKAAEATRQHLGRREAAEATRRQLLQEELAKVKDAAEEAERATAKAKAKLKKAKAKARKKKSKSSSDASTSSS